MFTTASRCALSSLLASGLLLLAAPALAQQKEDADESKSVPLKKVVMFTSGVGYFEHRGEVEGNAKVEMYFSAEDINDLLKSMVLEDRGGGRISTVTYGSRDPITKTLQTFPIDLTSNPTLGNILNQVRGQRVEIDAPTAVTGVLLGVETRRKHVDELAIEVEFLNLLTDDGLRSVAMDSISRIRLLNEKLDKEFHQALAVLATAHNNDKKSVTLDFLGDGTRDVRVGYIQETPVWKTSYRLVLDEQGKPFLQGWAIVENTSEEDWDNVELTLVSGRPISYRMDLYEPLYVERPLEQLELYASLRPQVYDQDLAQRAKAAGGAMNAGGMVRREMLGRTPAAAPMPAEESMAADTAAPAYGFAIQQQASMAQGGDVGELFQYAIDTPVTLARQKSAMLPIVNQSVQGEKLSIYNQAVQVKHPLNGLRLVNATDLHLMQGPITVFDGATYAGDAKIDDLAPGAERLISYALDLSTEVSPETKGLPEQLVNIKLIKGTMQITRKYARETNYTVKNSDSKPKQVLIEQPRDAAWKLVAPEKPAETTRDKYRFAVTAKPDEPAKLRVAEENVVQESLVLSSLNDKAIAFFINQKQVTPEVKQALQEVVKRKLALAELVARREQLDKEIKAIGVDQERVRNNMARLDQNSDLYRRYVQKFGEQEDAIDKMRVELDALQAEAAKQQRSLDEYLVNLSAG